MGLEEGRSAVEILTGKHTGRRLLRRPRPRIEDNIRMFLKEMDTNTRNWVGSAQDGDNWSVVNVRLDLRGPYAVELVSMHSL